MNERNLIEVEDLHVRYGDFEAVRGVSFVLLREFGYSDFKTRLGCAVGRKSQNHD